MTTRAFVLGTRGSRLALAQSTTVARVIEEAGARLGENVRVELEVVRTHGDVSAAPLAALGGVGVFAAQLRLALLGGECDLAVHSFKDLPTPSTPGLRIAAVPQREDPRDALCAADGATLSSLPAGALVGTGSPRRAAQVLAARPDLRVCDLRGNVPTRLSRVRGIDLGADAGTALQALGTGEQLDGVILALAGRPRHRDARRGGPPPARPPGCPQRSADRARGQCRARRPLRPRRGVRGAGGCVRPRGRGLLGPPA